MPANFDALNTAVAAAAAQATKTSGTEASAGVIIAAIKTQVTAAVVDALNKEGVVNQGSIDVATKAISDTLAVFADADDKLGAAIAANNPAE